jgi:asparagine synthase (glutamine-hydrolysing)
VAVELANMTRWLAGVFDPGGRSSSTRLQRSLEPHQVVLVEAGPLRVAHSGDESRGRAPLCLLDGYLDNASELSDALGSHHGAPHEELLAAAWVRWGSELPARMRGDFALLVWDEARGQGLLARDQLGVRAIFIHETSGVLSFAGEIRHLLALLPQRPSPDPVSVAHWITMSNRPGSATLYAGVHRLDPGSMLLFDRGGAREVAYWTPRFAEPLSASEPQLADKVSASLNRAVALRISDDGLTGVLMSGGLDSSSVAAVAAAQAPGRVSAQSAVFPDHPAVDESVLIADLRKALGLGGITAEVRAGGLLASAVESIREWDLPLRSWGDFWALPLLRSAAAAGVRVTLGGDGGDELFGTRAYLSADRLRAGHPLQALALVKGMPGAGEHPPRREVARIFANTTLKGALPYHLHRLLHAPRARHELPAWLSPSLTRELVRSDDPLRWKRLDGPRWWAEIAHGLTRGVEEMGVFEHQRRRATSAGLQARHPLFDLELVELCLRLAPSATFDRHRSRPVLRAAMAGLLPDTVRLRPGKALFDSLLLDCLAGADGARAQTLLTDPQAELGAYVDLPSLHSALFGSGTERSFRWMWQLWRLLNAEFWLRSQTGDSLDVLAWPLSAPRVKMRNAASGAVPLG